MSTNVLHFHATDLPTRSSVRVGKALADLEAAQNRKAETAFDFEQAIRDLVNAENRLFFAKLHSQAKYSDR